MAQNKKEMYYSPEMKVFEVKMEGVICGTITITKGVTVVKAYNSYGSAYKMNIGKGASSNTQCGIVRINESSGEIPGGSKYEYRP